jgi:hypothetical protein
MVASATARETLMGNLQVDQADREVGLVILQRAQTLLDTADNCQGNPERHDRCIELALWWLGVAKFHVEQSLLRKVEHLIFEPK